MRTVLRGGVCVLLWALIAPGAGGPKIGFIPTALENGNADASGHRPGTAATFEELVELRALVPVVSLEVHRREEIGAGRIEAGLLRAGHGMAADEDGRAEGSHTPDHRADNAHASHTISIQQQSGRELEPQPSPFSRPC